MVKTIRVLICFGVVSRPMPEEVLFEIEQRMGRTEIADYLRTVADHLERGESITLKAGDRNVTLDPPQQPTFEVKAERETEQGEPDELSIEFELEWDDNGDDGGELSIG